MGLFYYLRSVAMVEDLSLEGSYASTKDFYAEADKRYGQVSTPIAPHILQSFNTQI